MSKYRTRSNCKPCKCLQYTMIAGALWYAWRLLNYRNTTNIEYEDKTDADEKDSEFMKTKTLSTIAESDEETNVESHDDYISAEQVENNLSASWIHKPMSEEDSSSDDSFQSDVEHDATLP